MSAPRTKRQFAGAASDPAQRQITSFFTTSAFSSSSSPSTDPSSRTQTTASSDLRGPLLPDSVQANLISVGMRVRKSVPEGYKTGTYSAFALWDETDSSVVYTTTSAMTMGEGRSRANAISTPRELLPFCGIHKVGGLSTQPETRPSANANINISTYQPLLSVNGLPLDDSYMSDDVPGLTSSQETVESAADSVLDTPPKTRKRSYTEEEENDGGAHVPMTPDRLNVSVNAWRSGTHTATFDFDGEVSPRSLAPGGGGGWGPGNGRVMAVPRKARLRGGGGSSSKLAAGAHALDQENVMVMGSGGGGGDFDEADFLDNNTDWEVEMRDA
ncbi:ribonucleotide reductase inhibitor-domain-containing protein [Hypoxylon rubiginosum]|uniref:Ribonucleotide reductase inhibitor-domain-containing protein n=1 Tax=Hypoxylon rubiginosum TaxID=110542 RepID=A0ACB9YJC7_9PEZI|nr:ribonucleotide reductase inhibitor-domain-containing protein [Hypoxylon rubiginosum]